MKNNPIVASEVASYSVDIYIAGDRASAISACRDFCMEGFCVSIADVDYVFTGGMESGVRVGLINYARFPKEPNAIFAKAEELSRLLIERLSQQSCSIVGPDRTVWLSRRSWT